MFQLLTFLSEYINGKSKLMFKTILTTSLSLLLILVLFYK